MMMKAMTETLRTTMTVREMTTVMMTTSMMATKMIEKTADGSEYE